ncbi:aluminum-activated malate transporter 10-like [Carica papaya]|uniref:aluminum-activated malate transporter 10-like n=1 Tax=Carica papaya TaxID=3649 RepID=UPI000B8CE134|nr:aluminum-activated malate transporter 10-like [Carica papaya]
MKGLISWFGFKVWRFLERAWEIGVDDPRKVIHCLKLGLALTLISFLYFMRPLYEGFGKNAMWAIMTVVVVYEQTVGATLYKSLNRMIGTSVAGFLAVGVHWVATQSGQKYEPFIVGIFVFILGSAATFSRFIPIVKARFDYGALIFILTFSLVTISGYRVDELLKMAQQRVSTIIIGTSLCTIVIMLVCPVWAGEELHNLIILNMNKLANSLDGCVTLFFNNVDQNNEESQTKLLGYKSVLSSKGNEESMANFARWEPAHGQFNFRHPWEQYLKIGAAIRRCAYCIEALNTCLTSDNHKASQVIKKQVKGSCLRLSSIFSSAVKELGKSIQSMRKPSTVNLFGEMNNAVQELQNDLKSISDSLNLSPPSNPQSLPTLMEIIPLVTFVALLIEIASRVEVISNAVEELGNVAEFKDAESPKKSKQNQNN